MGKGLSGATAATSNTSRPRLPFFSLGPGQETDVRFITDADDIEWAHCARVPAYGNYRFPRTIPIRDQGMDGSEECPLMEAVANGENGFSLTVRAWALLIWREGPVYDVDKDSGKIVLDKLGKKKIVGLTDQVAVWDMGPMILKSLEEVAAEHKGLTSRDFTVKRTGDGVSTRYHFSPVSAKATPFSEQDLELIAEAPELSAFSSPGPVEAYRKIVNAATGRTDPPPKDDDGDEPQIDSSAFSRRR